MQPTNQSHVAFVLKSMDFACFATSEGLFIGPVLRSHQVPGRTLGISWAWNTDFTQKG